MISQMQSCFRLTVCIVVGLLFVGAPANAQSDGKLKIGFVYFLSGPGASFGIHARNGSQLIVDALNSGSIPAPYNAKGIGGFEIVPIYVDEAGGAQKQLAEYRRIVERDKVDVVIGYNSSADCNALGPVAEEMQKITVFFYCGHSQMFEEVLTQPVYSFRTAPPGTIDSIAAARYILGKYPNTATIAGINQNYSWGTDSWSEFKASMETLKPSIKATTAQFPKLGAGEYGAEISALLANPADVIFSSFWGGDADAFILQAKSRDLSKNSKLAFCMGTGIIDGLGAQMIEGAIVGARGPHSFLSGNTPLSQWFNGAYEKAYGQTPTFGASAAAQAILGYKAAFEKAAAKAKKTPTTMEIIESFRGLEFETPSGFPIRMAKAKGHEGIQATAYGTYSGWDKAKNKPIITDVKYFNAECVNPPADVKAMDWIKSGFKGAKCD